MNNKSNQLYILTLYCLGWEYLASYIMDVDREEQ